MEFGQHVKIKTTIYKISKLKLKSLVSQYGHSLSHQDYNKLNEENDFVDYTGMVILFSDLEEEKSYVTSQLFFLGQSNIHKTIYVCSFYNAPHIHNRTTCYAGPPSNEEIMGCIKEHQEFADFSVQHNTIIL